MNNLLLFGTGKIAEVAYYYITNDSPYKVKAFTVDEKFMTNKAMFGLPVIPFEEVENSYPPDEFEMLVAVGYLDLNKFRAAKYSEAKTKGYKLISYISSRASNLGNAEIGDNCFILENQAIQPYTKIGNNVTLWSGNHIGHHSTIGDHCFLSSQIVVSGNTIIEPYCFIGINVSIGHGIVIGRESIIGAGSLIMKSTKEKSVYISKSTEPHALDSNRFIRFLK